MTADALCLQLVGKGVPELLAEGFTWERIKEIAWHKHVHLKAEARKLEAMMGGDDEDTPGTRRVRHDKRYRKR